MPSIGNVVVKREKAHKLLPPVAEPIVKGPTHPVLAAPEIVSPPQGLILPGGKGALPGGIKEVIRGLTQTVIVGPGIVTRTPTYGVVGISYTQTSFTFESYTISGAPKIKSLTESITITEPLLVQRVKKRSIFEDAPELTELSQTVSIERTKTRALSEAQIIDEALTSLAQTHLTQTLSETDIISETLSTVKESKRLHTDTVSESGDVNLELPGAKFTLSETVDVSDAIVRQVTYGAGRIAREITENIVISDVPPISRLTKTRQAIETIEVAENLAIETTTSAIESLLEETVGESHTLRIERTKNRSAPAQTTNIIDSITGQRKSANDIIITDEVVMKVGRGRILTENVNVIG